MTQSRRVHQWLITAPQETFEALLEVTQERSRQEELGWTVEHDAEHGAGHLLSEAYDRLHDAQVPHVDRREVVKAAALLIAALEQIEREAASDG